MIPKIIEPFIYFCFFKAHNHVPPHTLSSILSQKFECIKHITIILQLPTSAYDYFTVCEKISRHGCVGRLVYNSNQSLTKGIHAPYAPPATNRARSRTLQKFPTSKTNKNFPHDPAAIQSETKFRSCSGGDMGEVLGERGRFGGRAPPSFKRGLSPSKVLLFLQGLPYPRSFASYSALTESARP